MVGWIILGAVATFILAFLSILMFPNGWDELVAVLLIWLGSSLLTIVIFFGLTWVVFYFFGLLKYGIRYVWGATFILFIINGIFHKGGSKS